MGIIVGGIVRLIDDDLTIFEFSPEIFFFILLPPIIFEAGYSVNRKDFFENIGAITLYAMFGTLISTFVVGGISFYAAKIGLIGNVDKENPMEGLLFGALISSVDPVATLSILGNAELNCDPLLYSLVFGESVLNDAIAISLFKVFAKYYNPEGPDWSEAEIPSALWSFAKVSFLSILIGVGLGLACSFVYKHTHLSEYPNLETSLLFSFCYLCYATGESFGLSGIMALFFQGVVLSHYNSYNLSPTAHVASEQIFATLATIAETAVFLYMGMGVFTGRFDNYDPWFSLVAFGACLIGRFFNIFPLSWVANLCRKRNKIPIKMQCVLWFAGLRGAIAFALAMNMPGPNKEVYETATLSICIFTTVVLGGSTENMLTRFGMKRPPREEGTDEEEMVLNRLSFIPEGHTPPRPPTSRRMYKGIKRIWKQFDDDVLKTYFGGSENQSSTTRSDHNGGGSGNYEMNELDGGDTSDSSFDDFVNASIS